MSDLDPRDIPRALIGGDDEAYARIRERAKEAGHDFGPAQQGVSICRICDLHVTEETILRGFAPCQPRPRPATPAEYGFGDEDAIFGHGP